MARVGEERLTVEQHEDGSAFYGPCVFSRPNHPLARLGRPFARGLQSRFARDSLRAMLLATSKNLKTGNPKPTTLLLDCCPD